MTSYHRKASAAVAFGLVAFTGLAGAQTVPATPTQQELLDEVRALRSEVKDLRSQVSAQKPATQPSAPVASADGTAAVDQPAAAVNTDALLSDLDRRHYMDMTGLTAGYDPAKGFVIRSEDGKFLLHPWVYLQVRDVTNYRQSGRVGGGDTTDTGLELARAKLTFDGNIFSTDVTYQFIWATSTLAAAAPTGGSLFLQDAWGRYHLPGTPLAVRAGNIRDPFDHEQILFGTRSLTPERSIVNNVFANVDGIVKGVSVGYGYDVPSPLRTEVAYTGGMRNTDTSFIGFPTNPATWGAAGRLEFKFMGDWNDYTQFTALGDKQPLLVLGGGLDYTEAGRTKQFSHVVDVQLDTPNGLNFFGAYLGRYVSKNGGPPGTNGSFTTNGRFPDTYDSTLRLQGGYLIAQHLEPFVRYEYIHFSGLEIARTSAHNVLQEFTLGMNYYFVGHRAKFSAAASYLPDGSPIANTQSDLLSNRHNEVIFQAQFQLIM